MADSSSSTSATTSEVTVNVKGPSEIKLSITIDLSSSVKDLKDAIHKQKEDVPAECQRLIYAGKVLKDDQPLSDYKLQNNHTIHLVKSATGARPAAAATSASAASTGAGGSSADSSASAGVPANFGAGQQFTNNPLAALNRADLAGPHMASIGRQMFQGTGMNPADPNMMMNALDSPEFQQHMRSMLRRPEVIDQMIAMHPEMAGMAPQMREMMQSDQFVDMMTNPETMRRMMQLQEAMGGRGGGGARGLGGLGALGGQQQQQQWPPPGTFGTPGGTNDSNAGNANSAGQAPSPQAQASNPFAALGGLGGPGRGAGLDPALLQQILGLGQGTGESAPAGGANPFAALGGGAGNPFAALGGLGGLGGGAGAGAGGQSGDSRPPEERFASQLQQLQDMGFVDGPANLRALLISGGSVEGAISILLGS